VEARFGIAAGECDMTGRDPRWDRLERGDVWLADLVKAVDDLRPDADAGAAILRVLGFNVYLRTARTHARTAHHPDLPTTPTPPPPVVPAPVVPQPPDPRERDPILLATVMASEAERTADPPSWVHDPAVKPIEPTSAPVKHQRLGHEPLFNPLEQRALLSATLATRAYEGEIDTPPIVQQRSQMRPIERLRRLPIATLRRGVQLLLDDSDGFAPYAADREEIARAIENIVGLSLVKTVRFVGSPERGVFPPRSEAVPWQLPARGTVLACISDFGIGAAGITADRADSAEWVRVVRRAEAAGCPFVGFIPFGPRHWNPVFARTARLVHWDRGTSIRAVWRAFGRGHQVD
jgi:hypothetical protein